MSYYKTPDNKLHSLGDDLYTYLLPAGAVKITDAEAQEIAAPPIETVRQTVWSAIKTKRDQLRFVGGVQVNDHWFKSDQIAVSEYNSIISLGIPDATVLRANWRTMDNGEVAMTPLLAKQIIQAGFAQAAAIDDAAQVHKTAMEASNDPANYDFSGGWPVTFEAAQ
jgi:hypothetical protein